MKGVNYETIISVHTGFNPVGYRRCCFLAKRCCEQFFTFISNKWRKRWWTFVSSNDGFVHCFIYEAFPVNEMYIRSSVHYLSCMSYHKY